MNITQSHRELIISALREKDITRKELASELNYSKSTISRLLTGQLKTIKDDDALKLERFLGVRFLRVADGQKVSGLSIEIGNLADQNPQFARVLAELIPLAQEGKQGPRYVPTKEMTKIGQEIIRLVFTNEDKPGKVAREVIKLLS